MLRPIFMLAAGLLAAGAVLTTADVASAGTAPIHRQTQLLLQRSLLPQRHLGVQHLLRGDI